MSITARILTGFVLLALAGIYFLLNPIFDRVERQYLEAAEEPMVDAAEVLAAFVSHEIETTGELPASLVAGMASAQRRELNAQIYNLLKERVLMDIYITDGRGVVVFDSRDPTRVGQDFSIFNDVRLTLLGSYGARSSRENEDDLNSSIMYVGAPLLVGGRIMGVLTVYKPQRSLRDFISETKNEILALGLIAIVIFVLIGVFFSMWVVDPLAKLTRHAEAVTRGDRPSPPRMPGRHLRVLAESIDRMRDALEGRKYVESYVQTFSHEMKAPVAAIRGASELLDEPDLPTEQRDRFVANIRSEARRLQTLIERLLALASIESRRRLDNPQPVDVAAVVRRVVEQARSRTLDAGLTIDLTTGDGCELRGDEFLLEAATGNLVQNSLDFSPSGGRVKVDVRREAGSVVITVEDEGPGLPDYAQSKVFDRFYSLPRPGTGRKSSGLGLCFVREAVELHGGTADLRNREPGPGAVAHVVLPMA